MSDEKSAPLKQAWWKRLLSHFRIFSIEKTKSDYSGSLEIVYSQGRYSLCTANAVYSYEDLYTNFRDAFYRLDMTKRTVERVLLLGVGLCSVPLILEKKFRKSFSCTAVDIDPEVIRLARKYGLPLINSPIKFHCEDAFEFVKKEKGKFDLVIVDLFIDDVVPSDFEKKEFLENLNKLLDENALLMFNRMATTSEALEKTLLFYEETFKKSFPRTDILTLSGNRMLIAFNNSL